MFCGIGIENTIMYENVKKAQARQSVAIETLSYHAVASREEATELKVSISDLYASRASPVLFSNTVILYTIHLLVQLIVNVFIMVF